MPQALPRAVGRLWHNVQFLKQNTPPVFGSPLTPATVTPIREGQRAASKEEGENVSEALLSSGSLQNN